MDSFEYTKIAGAVLSALLLIFLPKTIIDMRMEHAGAATGYTLPAGTSKEGATAPAKDKVAAGEPSAAAATAGGGDVIALLGKANADNGKAIFKKCAVCHTSEKGKPKAIGPNLWGVVNRPKASFEGFEYSPGMKSKGGEWTFADLGHFLSNPKGYVPGTKMLFNGLQSPEEEADVIAYLATLAEPPVPLPK